MLWINIGLCGGCIEDGGRIHFTLTSSWETPEAFISMVHRPPVIVNPLYRPVDIELLHVAYRFALSVPFRLYAVWSLATIKQRAKQNGRDSRGNQRTMGGVQRHSPCNSVQLGHFARRWDGEDMCDNTRPLNRLSHIGWNKWAALLSQFFMCSGELSK